MDLSAKEIDKAKFAFSIYDFGGNEKLDGVNLGDCLRALDLTPSLKTITKLGGTNKRGEKEYTIEEFLSIYADAKKDKDVGCLADYIEVLKCYDKHSDGNMLVSQLSHMLLATGEKMDNDAVQFIIKDCCDPPDDDGQIKYIPFITKVCKGPKSAFDDLDFTSKAETPSASATITAPSKKIKPSITVDDADTPSVSFAAAKPMATPRKESVVEANEPAAEATFTLKAPRKSITPTE